MLNKHHTIMLQHMFNIVAAKFQKLEIVLYLVCLNGCKFSICSPTFKFKCLVFSTVFSDVYLSIVSTCIIS